MIPALVLTAGLAPASVRCRSSAPRRRCPSAASRSSSASCGWLAGAGVTDAVLNLHHLPDTITGSSATAPLTACACATRGRCRCSGSAGGPRRALPLLGASAFLIVNGDTLTNVDVARPVADAHAHPARCHDGRGPEHGAGQVQRLAGRCDGALHAASCRAGRGRASYHFVGVQVAEAAAFATAADNVPFESVQAAVPGAHRGAARQRARVSSPRRSSSTSARRPTT